MLFCCVTPRVALEHVKIDQIRNCQLTMCSAFLRQPSALTKHFDDLPFNVFTGLAI